MPRTIRVLLIEDNVADAELTRETLESGKLRIDVSHVADGVHALEWLRAAPAPPDLVLLDLNLPRLDGRGVLAEMRGDEALKTIPVVILTSSDAEQDIVKTYQLGANCYVTKPVGLHAFQEIVRSVESFWFTVVRLP